MTNSVKLVADELIICLINEAVSNMYKCKMYAYFKYAPDCFNLVLIYYVDDCVYWYTYEELRKWFMDTL